MFFTNRKMKAVTIVGCGQVGANIAKKLQKSNHLKIMETPVRKKQHNNPGDGCEGLRYNKNQDYDFLYKTWI